MEIMDYFRAKASRFAKKTDEQENKNKKALFNNKKVLRKAALTLAVISTMTVMTSCAKISEFNDYLRDKWGWDKTQQAETDVTNKDQFGNTIDTETDAVVYTGEDALKAIESAIMAQTNSGFCQLNGIKTDTQNGKAIVYELQNYYGKNPHDAVQVTCNVSLNPNNLDEITVYTLMVPTSVMEDAGLQNYLVDYTRGDIISLNSADAGRLVGMGNGVQDYYGQSVYNNNNTITTPNTGLNNGATTPNTPSTPSNPSTPITPSNPTTPSNPSTPTTPSTQSDAVEQAIENAIVSGNQFLGLGQIDLNSAKTTMNGTQAQVTIMQNYNGLSDFECVFVECVVTENGQNIVLHLPVPTEVLRNAGINDYIINYTKGQSMDNATAQALIDAFDACEDFYAPQDQSGM